jgi:hypothetical protein
VREIVSISCEGEGGEAGGASTLGRGPGLQMGMCLFGTAAGVPRCEVLIDRCGGGVAVRSMLAGAAHTSVALILYIGRLEGRFRCCSDGRSCVADGCSSCVVPSKSNVRRVCEEYTTSQSVCGRRLVVSDTQECCPRTDVCLLFAPIRAQITQNSSQTDPEVK